MPELIDDEEQFKKQAKQIEEKLGFDHLDNFKVFNGVAHYGVAVVNMDGEDETVHQKRAYLSASSPLVAMVEVWDSIYNQLIASGLEKLGEFATELIDEGRLTRDDALDNLLGMLRSEEFQKSFLSNLMKMQPDIITIGNPNVVTGFNVEKVGDNITESVEKFLKEVVENKESEEE
jgi:hypothetical protein